MDIDLLDGAWYAGQPLRASGRGCASTRRSTGTSANDVWGITRYHDVLAIEKDPKTFSPPGAPAPRRPAADDDLDGRPPAPARRKLVNRGFTPRRVGDRARPSPHLHHIIDRVCERGSATSSGTSPLRCRCSLIGDMLGFPGESYDDLLRWSDDMIRGTTARPAAGGGRAGPRAEARRSASSSSASSPTGGPKPPRTTSSASLCHAEIDGDRLDDESIVQETPADPHRRRRDDPPRDHRRDAGPPRPPRPAGGAGRRPRPRCTSAVEELLRWVSPIKNMARTVTTRRRAAGPAAPRGRPGDALLPVGQPRRGGVRPSPTGSTWPATRTPTWRSASAPTSASAPRWPGWSCG